jgi:hypothetical protein
MKWRPIKTAPRDGTRILLQSEIGLDDGVFVGSFDTSADVDVDRCAYPFGPFVWRGHPDGTVAEDLVTHWMPLPKGPA